MTYTEILEKQRTLTPENKQQILKDFHNTLLAQVQFMLVEEGILPEDTCDEQAIGSIVDMQLSLFLFDELKAKA